MHFGSHDLGSFFLLLLAPEERSDPLRGGDRLLPPLVGKLLRPVDQPIQDADLLVAPLLDLGDRLLALLLKALDSSRLVKMTRAELGPMPSLLVDLLVPGG